MVLLNLAEASSHKEISSCFAGTSSNSSAVTAKSALRPSTVQNEVALIRQATVCRIFKHLRYQYEYLD